MLAKIQFVQVETERFSFSNQGLDPYFGEATAMVGVQTVSNNCEVFDEL
jgi:hypothetical protein